ncbi:profilin-3-like [Narcine bancroftii]|uniref:profilin-3-like n=1 Tax=Narcine bancroftii TaxID=1343680 RepID=UPI0038322362
MQSSIEKMAGWRNYINYILKDKNVEDVAIVGQANNRAVWASKPGGIFAAISPQEVSALMGQDRRTFLQTGITVGGKKCSIVRDNLLDPDDGVMDVRMKGGQSKSICVGKSIKAIVYVMGRRGVHGGVLNTKVHEIINYLKLSGI